MTASFTDRFDAISPIDNRYWDPEVAAILSDRAFLRYKLRVEAALAKTLAKRRVCSPAVAKEIEAACAQVNCEEVEAEEKRIGHDIRALANCIRAKVSDEAKRFVHLTATSYDIIDTANALRYRDAADLLHVRLLRLIDVLADIAEREAETVQIGRTHGQHAVPITFGFAIANYVSRLGECSERIFGFVKNSAFPGKFSGAVGAYNASSLVFDDPEKFERDLLQSMFVPPAEIATQIVPPDQLARFLSETAIAAGIMANLADDMRNLQRSEIAEIGEAVSADQVGSSTMPQKKNPITFENVKSMFKIVSARLGTVHMDLVSEHQRDLTGSASGRAAVEIVAYAAIMAQRLAKAMAKLTVDRDAMRAKVMAAQSSAAEAMYIALAAAGHPDAHEAVRILARDAVGSAKNVFESAQADPALQPYLEKLTPRQIECITSVHAYTGIAAEKARAVAHVWRERLAW